MSIIINCSYYNLFKRKFEGKYILFWYLEEVVVGIRSFRLVKMVKKDCFKNIKDMNLMVIFFVFVIML